MLKLYVVNCGWRGMIFVVEESLEAATKIIETYANYFPDQDGIEEHEITKGFSDASYGDM